MSGLEQGKLRNKGKEVRENPQQPDLFVIIQEQNGKIASQHQTMMCLHTIQNLLMPISPTMAIWPVYLPFAKQIQKCKKKIEALQADKSAVAAEYKKKSEAAESKRKEKEGALGVFQEACRNQSKTLRPTFDADGI